MIKMVDLLKSFQKYISDNITFTDKRKIVEALVENIIVYTDYDNGQRDIPIVTIAINYVFKNEKNPLKRNYQPSSKQNIHGF